MKYTKLTVSLLAVTLLAGCSWFQQPPATPRISTSQDIVTPSVGEVTYRDLTADELSLALLTPEDVAAEVADAHPLPVEFNGQLDPYLQEYDFYLGRLWNDANGDMLVSDAVTRYTSAAAAQTNVSDLSAGCDQVLIDGIGDVFFVCYDDPLLYYGSPSDPASMVYRFTLGQYGVRLDLVDTGDVTDDNSVIYDRLDKILGALALVQEQHLQELAALDTADLVASAALERLPDTLAGTTLVGTGALTAEEWMSLTGDTTDELTGFISGAIRRFQSDARPDEVVEVIVMEFETAAQAEALRADFVNVVDDSLVESQVTVDNFFYDIGIFSPFADMDGAAAELEMATYLEEI